MPPCERLGNPPNITETESPVLEFHQDLALGISLSVCLFVILVIVHCFLNLANCYTKLIEHTEMVVLNSG